MDELRWILLLAGAGILLSIYAVGKFSAWRQARRDRLVAATSKYAPGKVAKPTREPKFVDEADTDFVDPLFSGSAIGRSNDPYADIRLDDDEVEIEEITTTRRVNAGEETVAPAQRGEPEKIIVIHVRARSEQGFSGQNIKRVMDALEMDYGKLHIFHRYPSDRSDERAIFSVANMFEPGWFDLERIDNFVTPGLTFFMQLPGPVDDVTAYDDMLACADYVGHELGGDLLDDQHVPCNHHTLAHSREKIIEWSKHRLGDYVHASRQ